MQKSKVKLKIVNCKLKIVTGFTLIEALVVLSVFSILALSSVTIFVSVLRVTAKARVIQEIKQNGDHTLLFMTRSLRFAKEITDCSGDTQVNYLDGLGNAGSFTCVNSGPGVTGYIASGSASLTDQSVVVASACSIACLARNGVPYGVAIGFTLDQVGSGNVNEKASERFETQVGLRTL